MLPESVRRRRRLAGYLRLLAGWAEDPGRSETQIGHVLMGLVHALENGRLIRGEGAASLSHEPERGVT
jgi:hypothetical protein